MFIIDLTYTAPLADIDAGMRAHMVFLRKHYASGHFVVSGRKIPRDGGIILAVADSRETIEAIVRQDPFVSKGLAEFRVIEFRASQKAKDVRELIILPSAPSSDPRQGRGALTERVPRGRRRPR